MVHPTPASSDTVTTTEWPILITEGASTVEYVSVPADEEKRSRRRFEICRGTGPKPKRKDRIYR